MTVGVGGATAGAVAGTLALIVITFTFRGAATLLPRVPDALRRRIGGLAPALLAALVVTQLSDDQGRPTIDAKAVGVAAAMLLAWRRAPFAVCVVAGAAVAAALRAAGFDRFG